MNIVMPMIDTYLINPGVTNQLSTFRSLLASAWVPVQQSRGSAHLESVGSTRTLSYTLKLTPFLARDSRTAFTGGRSDKFLSVIRQTFRAPRFWRSWKNRNKIPNLFWNMNQLQEKTGFWQGNLAGKHSENIQWLVVWRSGFLLRLMTVMKVSCGYHADLLADSWSIPNVGTRHLTESC